MATIGIDPGTTGAVAVINEGSVHVFDVPTIKMKIGKTTRARLDDHGLVDLLRALFATYSPELVILEQCQSFGKMAHHTNFLLGEVYGATRMALAASDLPFELVSPTKWKKALGAPTDKEASRLFAIRQFPEWRNLFARKMDHNRAEAALLALYAERCVLRS